MSISILRKIPKPKPNSTISIALLTTTTIPSPPPDPLISSTVSLLTNHRSKSRWSTLRSLSPSGFTPPQFSEITLNLRNNPHLSLNFFLFTRRYSLCPHNLHSYSTLIHILARSRLKTHARDIISLALRQESVSSVFRSLVKSYNRCGSAPFVFDLLVKSCIDYKEINGALMIMRKLKSRGIDLQISTCNALISHVADASTGYELYREIFDDGTKIKPNVDTLNLMMMSFYREGDLEMVERIWREMKCSPNGYSFSVVMEMYCDRGMMIEAEKIWEEMKVKGVGHDVVAYNVIIGGFCRNLEVGRAKELFKEMGSMGLACTSLTYERLVNGYCKVGDVDSGLSLYREMKRESFGVEGLTIEALVDGLCDGKKERVVEAAEIVKSAVRESEFYPSRKCYELLIKRLCEEGEMDRALSIQGEMVGRGFKPSRETYKAFIDGYGAVGDDETCALLAKEMEDSLGLGEKES